MLIIRALEGLSQVDTIDDLNDWNLRLPDFRCDLIDHADTDYWIEKYPHVEKADIMFRIESPNRTIIGFLCASSPIHRAHFSFFCTI